MERKYRFVEIIIIILLTGITLLFGFKKQGFHYDENYSYYSSNVTVGLYPPDGEWMTGDEIRNEFMVLPGQGYNYGMVKQMQEWDVHPPLYYYLLHTICSITSGIYSKWQGLGINIVLYAACLALVGMISAKLLEEKYTASLLIICIYGLSPGVISGVMFVRMYVLLSFFCLLSLYIHILGLEKRTRQFYISLIITGFLGFMTHYYFLVFYLFEAVYFFLYCITKKDAFKESIKYGLAVVIPLLLGVIYYPASLSHMFRGYRGTEAIDAFRDSGNIMSRLGLFGGILNEYTFSGFLYPVLAIIVIITVAAIIKKNKNNENIKYFFGTMGLKKEYWLCFTVTAGYFTVVTKTALTTGNEAVRYNMPMYGPFFVVCCVYIAGAIAYLMEDKKQKIKTTMILLSCILVLVGSGLLRGKVVYLYQEDKSELAFAKKNSREEIMYIYNYNNYWNIWDIAPELMEYKKIYFLEMNSSKENIPQGEKTIVYLARQEEAMDKLQEIMKKQGKNIEKVGERIFADIYIME